MGNAVTRTEAWILERSLRFEGDVKESMMRAADEYAEMRKAAIKTLWEAEKAGDYPGMDSISEEIERYAGQSGFLMETANRAEGISTASVEEMIKKLERKIELKRDELEFLIGRRIEDYSKAHGGQVSHREMLKGLEETKDEKEKQLEKELAAGAGQADALYRAFGLFSYDPEWIGRRQVYEDVPEEEPEPD